MLCNVRHHRYHAHRCKDFQAITAPYITSNGVHVVAYDPKENDYYENRIELLWKDFEFFTPLAGIEKIQYAEEVEDILGHSLPKLSYGAVIGYVYVYDFTEHSKSVWAQEDHGAEWKWMLRNAKLFKEPIPYKGKLGIFNVPDIDPNNLPKTVD